MRPCIARTDMSDNYRCAQWVPVDVQDLLELLGSSFVKLNAASWVREFAVKALRERATDGQLLSYLLPLVQAIQYEQNAIVEAEEGPLAKLLIERAAKNAELGNFFHWCARQALRSSESVIGTSSDA